MQKKILVILCLFLLFPGFAISQTLQKVTDSGNVTTNSIIIRSAQGLNIGVDSTSGYTVNSHSLKPSAVDYRILRFNCATVDSNGGWEFYNSSLSQSLMYIKQGGNIGIGTTTPKAKLAVNGDILTTKIKVTQSGWPDYVFEPSYVLPTLQQLEIFVKEHKHLPDIPSASEVEEQGIDLGQNQAKLLQKIEELTLYLIEQNKKLETQYQTILEQQQKLSDQEARLKEVEKRQSK